jgi:hypothetical protein
LRTNDQDNDRNERSDGKRTEDHEWRTPSSVSAFRQGRSDLLRCYLSPAGRALVFDLFGHSVT